MSISYDKFAGCLLGQCIGDAVGFPVEGHTGAICTEYLQEHFEPLWKSGKSKIEFLFGQYTDDSQMARELLASLSDHPQFDPHDYIERLLPLFQSRTIVGPGLACMFAIKQIEAGVPWEEAGSPPPKAGNGTAMRTAPVGMCYCNYPETIIKIARIQGRITHQDLRCDAGSIAIAGAVALALQGKCEPDEFCKTLAGWMSCAHKEFAAYVEGLPQYLDMPPEVAVKWMSRVGMDPGMGDSWPGISPFVIGTVLWSLYAFLRSPDDYYTSVWTAIAVGGDVDTTGAITGAISGAYNGKAALAQHVLDKLHDHGEWKLKDLEKLCRKAYNVFYNG
ncbi:MAG: ADP-ribosylglycohydrolase family protein [Candidatus Zixiibacteriota bacterium]